MTSVFKPIDVLALIATAALTVGYATTGRLGLALAVGVTLGLWVVAVQQRLLRVMLEIRVEQTTLPERVGAVAAHRVTASMTPAELGGGA